MNALVLAALLAVSLVPGARAGDRPWTPEAIQRLARVSDPQVSPDGRWVAYVVEELSADGSARHAGLWRASVATGEARRLTEARGRDESPRWSPDGTRIAFVSDRPRPGAPEASPGAGQLWLLPAGGGEAAPLTEVRGGVLAPQWSADGRFIAFVSPEAGADTSQAMRLAAGAGSPEAGLPWLRLWTVDVASARATRLTRGPLHVTGFSIAPDGRRIVFSAQPGPEPAAMREADLWSVPVTGGEPGAFVKRPGEDQAPVFSPDGRWVAFLGEPEGQAGWWANRHVFVIRAAGGAPADVTPDFDGQAEGVREGAGPLWQPGGDTLYFLAASRTDRRLFRAFADARPPQVAMRASGVDADASLGGPGPVLAWVHEEPTRPADVWVWPTAGGTPRALTGVHADAAGFLAIPKRVVTWSAPDGRQVEGLLVSPVRPVPGTRPPLLVVLHGGPAWTHLAAFTAGHQVYPYALLAQRGWAVLLPNPRGSDGYGAAYRGAIEHDWGGRDVDDVLAGVDELVRLGFADGDRLAVCGWSYGGYLAATIVTRTDRFKAALVGAGMTDLGAMTASDVPELSRAYLGAWPWEDPAAYVDRSPLYHAGAVKTPTAFVHGGADRRVPPGQALAMWQALRRRGVPTDFLLLPGEPHVPFDPRHQRAAMQFHLDWLDQWVPLPRPSAASRAAAPETRGRTRP